MRPVKAPRRDKARQGACLQFVPMTGPDIPTRCEVLVVGAGPAGSACAHQLAAAGIDVLLVDQHAFPRDKVCGDGLIPDAHAALQRLGAYDEVASLARHLPQVRCIAPRGGHVDVPGRIAVLQRKTLDHVLVRHAQRVGARLLTPMRFEAPLLDGECVVGARLGSPDGSHEVSARWLVLATGAAAPALITAGVCERRAPSAVALRGYVRHPGLADAAQQLQLRWHGRLRGGYGWIFPAPGGLFNIGAGLNGSPAQHGGSLRSLFDAFCAVHPAAADLMRDGELVSPLKGAPLRCTLSGARWSRPGLLVTGEAAGSTYAFTGEGIGKALETGMLAAQALRDGRRATDTSVRQTYEASLAALRPRFALYETANRINSQPWIADIVVWRAQRSASLRRRLTGLLDETSNPGNLFSWRGVGKLLFE